MQRKLVTKSFKNFKKDPIYGYFVLFWWQKNFFFKLPVTQTDGHKDGWAEGLMEGRTNGRMNLLYFIGPFQLPLCV